ncbi:MAG TPA: FecR domain-containing protein [Flavobacterium sp.]|nr:FecR domain-containing protein [Flavobacterium sp.]
MKDHNSSENSEITILLTKFARGLELSINERKLLDSWAQESNANQQIVDRISDPNLLASDLISYDQSCAEEGLKDLNRILNKQEFNRRHKKWFIPAAAVLLISLSISFFFIQRNSNPKPITISTNIIQDDILPGGNKATLILSNGKQIVLDEKKQGIVIGNSSLNYGDGTTLATTVKVETAILKTPRAGQYDVVLQDGTKISLNAESSLEYPVRFTGSERRVKLTGEGYFEVAHNKRKPFHVETKNQDVQVLGTVFNIRSYSAKESTTLLSGKVIVKSNTTKESSMLMPGQNVTATPNILTIQNVDIQDYVSWKKGFIGGTSISLLEMLAEIERWYDVEVKIDKNLNNSEKALLSISRQEKLSVVLNGVSEIYGVNFQIRGKEVIIRQK